MKYVIIRDDDTCALTPIECLETLYRPFLERGFPVNLATIPNVRSDVFYPRGPLKGQPEGFLAAAKDVKPGFYPLASNAKVVEYLRKNRGYRIAQHGCHHEFIDGAPEFDIHERQEIARRLDLGREHLRDAGFPNPCAFVAPYDRITRAGFPEIAKRFPIISTGWFEFARMPVKWLPKLLATRLKKKKHFRIENTLLLSHPGCILSYQRPVDTIFPAIQKTIASQSITVLVTHWWEFFRQGEPALPMIGVLHELARWLDERREARVIAFEDLLSIKQGSV